MSANASDSDKTESSQSSSDSRTVGYVCPSCGWFLEFEAREPSKRTALLRDHAQGDHGRRGAPRDSFRFGFLDELRTDVDVQLVEDDAPA